VCGGGVVTTFCQQHFLVVNDMLLGDIDKLSTSIGTSINWRCQESIGDEPASCHCLLLLRCCSWHCCNWHYNLGLDVLNCEPLEVIFVDGALIVILAKTASSLVMKIHFSQHPFLSFLQVIGRTPSLCTLEQ
jgi:hypothetical protein